MTALILGVLGVFITAVASIATDLLPESWHYRKTVIALTIIGGGTLAIVFTVIQYNDTVAAETKNKSLLDKMNDIGITVDKQTGVLTPLGQGNTLAPGKYSVRISAGATVAELQLSMRKLRNQFPGIDSSEICVAESPDPRDVKSKYRLYFGRHLNFTTAALFHTLATNSGFPPANEKPSVVSDDKNQCEQ